MIRRLASVKPFLLFALLTLGSWLAWLAWSIRLADTRFFTGWVLFACVLFLALLGARKTVPFLPLGSVTAWLNLHIFVGLFAGVLIALHLSFRWPTGLLDIMLAGVFLLVFFSGAVGLVLSRTVPAKLNASGLVLPRIQIPTAIRQIADQADDLVVKSVTDFDSEVIPHLYAAHLKAYFCVPGTLSMALWPDTQSGAGLISRVDELHRFASPAERQLLEKIVALIREKQDLDLQYVRHGFLKFWLYVHVPLTYSLILLMLAHTGLAYLFRGNAL